jgi:hypothetical protein
VELDELALKKMQKVVEQAEEKARGDLTTLLKQAEEKATVCFEQKMAKAREDAAMLLKCAEENARRELENEKKEASQCSSRGWVLVGFPSTPAEVQMMDNGVPSKLCIRPLVTIVLSRSTPTTSAEAEEKRRRARRAALDAEEEREKQRYRHENPRGWQDHEPWRTSVGRHACEDMLQAVEQAFHKADNEGAGHGLRRLACLLLLRLMHPLLLPRTACQVICFTTTSSCLRSFGFHSLQ